MEADDIGHLQHEDPVLEVFHELIERGGYGVPDRLRQVRVDRRSSGVAMTQRLLNQAQMDATLHQVRGVGVPEGMNVRLLGNTARLQRVIKGALQAIAGDRLVGMFPTARRKKPIGRAVSFPKLTQAYERGFRQSQDRKSTRLNSSH